MPFGIPRSQPPRPIVPPPVPPSKLPQYVAPTPLSRASQIASFAFATGLTAYAVLLSAAGSTRTRPRSSPSRRRTGRSSARRGASLPRRPGQQRRRRRCSPIGGRPLRSSRRTRCWARRARRRLARRERRCEGAASAAPRRWLRKRRLGRGLGGRCCAAGTEEQARRRLLSVHYVSARTSCTTPVTRPPRLLACQAELPEICTRGRSGWKCSELARGLQMSSRVQRSQQNEREHGRGPARGHGEDVGRSAGISRAIGAESRQFSLPRCRDPAWLWPVCFVALVRGRVTRLRQQYQSPPVEPAPMRSASPSSSGTKDSPPSPRTASLSAEDAASQAASDEAILARLGYKQEFRREFTNLSTISFAFSIMGVASSVVTTFNTPFSLGGPASVVWCWFIGTLMNFCLGTSIAELVSAYPTNGGLYSASVYLVPKRHRALMGWTVGWLNLLGQVAGVASTEFGLAQMIFAAVSLSRGGAFVPTAWQTYLLFVGLLLIHGVLNSVGTRLLSSMTRTFVFFNLGTVLAVIISLLACTEDKNPASYVFTHQINGSGWRSDGLSFLLGLLSVQWTMTDYDATAHISEEVKRAQFAAPAAIWIAVLGTGIAGWVYNIIFVLCSGDMADTADYGVSGYAPAEILWRNVPKGLFYVLWAFICFVAFQVVATATHANARSFHAFSRDKGMPDRGFFARLAKNQIPVNAVWLVLLISAIMGLLVFASTVAVGAIFALAAMGMDSSYLFSIVACMLWRNHPEVMFKPGPFHLGWGWLGWTVRIIAVLWTAFVVVILALPQIIPVVGENMNYASVVTGGVVLIATGWFFLGGRRHYRGPRNVLAEEKTQKMAATGDDLDEIKAPVTL